MVKMKNALKIVACGIMTVLGAVVVNVPAALAEDLTTNVIIKPSLKITLSAAALEQNLDPSIAPFGEKNLTVTTATNNLNGYKLYLNADTTDLVNTVNNTKTIATLAGTVTDATATNFPENRWGYRISAGDTGDSGITSTTDYYPFVSGKVISRSNTATNGISSTLDFASKVDYTTTAGQYSIALNFKALPIVTQKYMQDMVATDCTNEPTIMIDSRDEHPYTVQRLADGKCWMLDNLDLDLTNRDVVDGLTTANTNINVTADPDALTYLKNGGGTTSDKYATAGLEYHNWTSSSSTPSSPNYSYSQPLVNRSGACIYDINKNYPCVGDWQNASYTHNTLLNKADAANTVYKDVSNDIGGPGNYKIGTYYNYCAASAGTYCYGNGTSSGTGSGDATSDICPAGWHMPSDKGGKYTDDGYSGDYLALCSAILGTTEGCSGTAWNTMSITASTSMQYQLSTPLSGNYNSGTAYRQGTNGNFWSSSYSSATNMRNLIVNSSGVYPQNNNNRNNGNSVRCVASV